MSLTAEQEAALRANTTTGDPFDVHSASVAAWRNVWALVDEARAVSWAENARLRAALVSCAPGGTEAVADCRAMRRWRLWWAEHACPVLVHEPGSRDALRQMLAQAAGAAWFHANPENQVNEEACYAIADRLLEGGTT